MLSPLLGGTSFRWPFGEVFCLGKTVPDLTGLILYLTTDTFIKKMKVTPANVLNKKICVFFLVIFFLLKSIQLLHYLESNHEAFFYVWINSYETLI